MTSIRPRSVSPTPSSATSSISQNAPVCESRSKKRNVEYAVKYSVPRPAL